MSVSDGDALRRAILDQPDDDTLRLIYADWLDENGQADRAAFVRAQVWAVQAEPYSPDARKHEATAARLRKAHLSEWTRSLGQWATEAQFARGFIEHVQVNAPSFPRNATHLFAAEPIRSVQVVRFASAYIDPGEATLDPFFQVPQLGRVTRLSFTGVRLSEGGDFDPLVECPYLANLTDLGLRSTPVPPGWLATALIGPALPALAGLDLSDVSHLGPCLASALPRTAHRRFLRLDLSRVTFTSDQIKAVLASACLRDVEELRLGWMTGIDREGALTHLNVGWVIPWNRLRLLDLSGQGVGHEGVLEIVKETARRREPSPLRWLGLANNRIGADGVHALVRSDPSKLKLYYLDVSGNGLTLSQQAALQTRFPEAIIKSHSD
jgi:uncharacterized protein (TIGR02996 family)